ncbi:unnamed protein product, partial [Nezara viridula]
MPQEDRSSRLQCTWWPAGRLARQPASSGRSSPAPAGTSGPARMGKGRMNTDESLPDFILRNRLQAGVPTSRKWKDKLGPGAVSDLQKGKIPLLLAVEAGNQSMCRELLSQSTLEQLRATSENGDTALHLAARKRDID